MPDDTPLDSAIVDSILTTIPRLAIGVAGDLFLDRYLDIDASLTEPSLETGLDAYQVVNVRSLPGAAGTVISNLIALGVSCVYPISILGEDGEGFELRQALAGLAGIDLRGVLNVRDRRTPTYTKPLLHSKEKPPRELNRLDIKNRSPLSENIADRICSILVELWPLLDALVVLDQVSEIDCGVITARVREQIIHLGESDSGKIVLADSRERIGLFRGMCLKPNRHEALHAAGTPDHEGPSDLGCAVGKLAQRAGRTVFCTEGAHGILVAAPQVGEPVALRRVPAYPVCGPIDIVGAGDATSAAIVCALACGVGAVSAAAFGNLVASITIQQIGTTGTANPQQIRQRWREVRS